MAGGGGFPVQEPEAISPRAAEELREAGSFFSSGEFNLTLIIFAFALLAIGFFYFLIRSGRATPYLLRIYVILILVFGTLLVVSSSYTTDQIAPVVGFFGTITGYLLGRGEKPSDTSN